MDEESGSFIVVKGGSVIQHPHICNKTLPHKDARHLAELEAVEHGGVYEVYKLISMTYTTPVTKKESEKLG